MQKINQWIGHYRTFMSLCLGLLFLWLAKPTYHSILQMLPIILLGETIRIWASGYLNKDTHEFITTAGPYTYTRNPLYVGNFFLGLGFVAMGNQWVFMLAYLILFFLIYRSTILDEEVLLTRMFGTAYHEYRLQVPRFFPNLISRNLLKQKVPFHWRQAVRREYKAWLGMLLVVILFTVKIYFNGR